MAIYRPPKARWPLAAAVGCAGLGLGILIGFLLGGSEPSPSESVRQIRSVLVRAAGSLEVAAVEYRESVDDGVVVDETEYEGALGALRSSRSRFATIEAALEDLFPTQVETIDELYDRAGAAMEARAPARRVEASLAELEVLLEGERGGILPTPTP